MTTATEEPVAGEIVQYAPPAAIEEYRPRIVMAPEEAKALDDALRTNMQAILRENVDFGVIPGTGSKPTLLKPGAEKLLQWFGFGHTMERVEIERDGDGQRVGVTYRCTVTKSMPDGRTVTVATCEGYAGYDEDRFFLTAEDARAKAEQRERANAARYNRPANTAKWEFITTDYRAPWNSVIKMCQKRALVGAALQATSASTLFTQDVEDSAESAAATPDALSAAGRTAISRLPQQVRDDLDAWYSALNWPDPDKWDAEQWCTALVKAGKLSTAPVPQAAPPAQATTTPEAPQRSQEDEDWADHAYVKAAEFETPKAGSELWSEIVDRHQDGRITDDERAHLSDLMKARLEDLRKEAA